MITPNVALSPLIAGVCLAAHCTLPLSRPKPRAACAGQSTFAIGVEIMNRIVRYREKSGLFGLERDDLLMAAAQEQAVAMARQGRMLLASRNGGPLRRLARSGIRRRLVGENTAQVPDTGSPSQSILAFWARRSTERSNLVGPRFMRMGVGVAGHGGKCYGVLILTD